MGTPSNSMFDYDAELSRYYRHLVEATDVHPGDTILDIGCGTGQTTREAARHATRGSALGVDVSPAMVTRARQLAEAENLHNVRFEQADAQVHPFPPAHFTLGVSRFGTMFFSDPVEAFANIGRALRPGARLVQLVWQDSGQQEWAAEIHRAFGSDALPPATGAFSFADPATVDGVLTAAGFTEVNVTEVREPVYYGADPDAAVEAVQVLEMASDLLTRLDSEETKQAFDRLHSTMAAHTTSDGVWFDSRAWLVTARR
ncbi:class I SAM-dependent methyltransferase [Kibdelosporangium aridum]|nr:class I SAM-dependent methyltransferase [Kibdelosporangium aridum]